MQCVESIIAIFVVIVDIPEWLWVFFNAPLEHDHKLDVSIMINCLLIHIYCLYLLIYSQSSIVDQNQQTTCNYLVFLARPHPEKPAQANCYSSQGELLTPCCVLPAIEQTTLQY